MNSVFEYEILIKENHLDSFGHVNNAVYLQLFEEARWDFITKNGYGLEHIQTTQMGPVILDIKIRFKRELKNREKVKIRSQVINVLNSKMIILQQAILKEDGKTSSDATFTIGFFDMKERKLIDAHPDWLRSIGAK